MSDQEWRTHAACKGLTGPNYEWFPPRGRRSNVENSTQRLLDICHKCPVELECRDFAIKFGEPGIWGGTSSRQRRAIKKQRAKGNVVL
jgi:WhiB family redox-sensing transcriptional regulator